MKKQTRRIYNTKAFFINLSAKIVSPFIKKKKNIWIFGESYGDKFYGNAKYLFLYISKYHPEINTKWFTRNNKIYKILKKDNLNVYKINSLKAIYYGFYAKVYIYTHNIRDIENVILKNSKLINLWHGMPIKTLIGIDSLKSCKSKIKQILYLSFIKISFQKIKQIDLMILSSEFFLTIMKKSFPLCNNFVISGEPRNDILFSEYDKNSFLKKFNIEYKKYKKIITYLPTFRDFGITKSFPDYIIKSFPDYLFIEKKHSNEIDYKQGKSYKNYLNLSYLETDTQKLLLCTDLLITDYSSLFFDFLLLDKPILLYTYDLEKFKKKRALNFDLNEINSIPLIKTEKDLIYYIKNINNFYDKNKSKKYLFHKNIDNQSSKRCYKEIIKII